MKYIHTFFIGLLSFITLYSQSGKVIYHQSRAMNIHIDGEHDEIKNMLPSVSETTKELLFNEVESLYKDVTKEQLHEFTSDAPGAAMNIMVKTRASREQVYIHHKDAIQVAQREIMDKLFLIEQKLDKNNWKILNDQKEILGYICMKASVQINDSTKIDAWFAPQIPISAGPSDYFGLPGLILEVNQNDGEVICVAKEIDLNFQTEIVKPKDGEKVSQAKYDEIREKKRKEMEEMYGAKGGNGVFIIRERN